MTFSVLTFNIWNYEGPWNERLPLIRACIGSLEPDLIALQEVLVGESIDQPALLFEGTPYGYEFARAQDFWLDPSLAFGNLVASRWPLAQTETLVLSRRDGAAGRVALFTDVQAPFGPVPFVSTHLTYPPYDGYVRERQVKEISELLRSRHVSGGFPAIVCGDFYARPESAEVRFMKGMQSIDGASTFFVDAFEAAGDGDGATMSRDNPFADPPLDVRIDYIFVGRDRPNGAGRVEACEVVGRESVNGVYPSDHYGVFATFSRGSP
ncbi:MAG: endonuclease/exonuclease/phosphatase family protein [Gammaproteobacteria bacterium]